MGVTLHLVTIKDIAKEAGVSVMTVSRVIHGNQEKVSKETTERIQKIIDRTGYIPNSSARSLVVKSSRIIAVIINMEVHDRLLMSPHNALLLEIMARKIRKESYYMMIHFVNTASEITQCLKSWRVDGCILMGIQGDAVKDIEKSNHIPKVYVDTRNHDVYNIGIDDQKGGYLATEYLITKGHRKMIMVSVPVLFPEESSYMRYCGFKQCIEEYRQREGYECVGEHIVEKSSAKAGEQIRRLMKEGYTAAFIFADNFAIEIMEDLKSHGVRIPEDFSVIGFDNQRMSYFVTPKLTTISQSVEEKGLNAVNMLFQIMQEEKLSRKTMVLPLQLVERESVRDICSEERRNESENNEAGLQ